MRKLLLATAATFVLAIGSGAAYANPPGPPGGPPPGGGGDPCNTGCSLDAAIAAAVGVNIGHVGSWNVADGGLAAAGMTGSIRGNEGVTQANQNAGAGALQQNAAAVALVEGVQPDVAVALAGAGNLGTVFSGNYRTNGQAIAGMDGSVRGNTGVTQANQNAGAGALQQNAAALAAIGLCGEDCVDVDLAATVALAGNVGTVGSWNWDCGCYNTAEAYMTDSIRGNVGLTQVQQNAGAGAMQQNAIAVGYIGPR